MAQIRQRILELDDEDVTAIAHLHDRAHSMETLTVVMMALGIVLTFVVFLFTLWKLKRDVMVRGNLERRLLEEAKLAEVSPRIADIGHDVKNMLTPIQLGMTILEEELDEHF